MTWTEIAFSDAPRITTAQRWSHYFAIAWGIIALLVVLNMRNTILSETSTYVNNEAGITAQYPTGWLLDESSADYIFRVRNMQEIGYKTTYQVSLRPISPDTTPRTIIDSLSMQRAQTLAAFRTLATQPFDISQELQGQQVNYTYVATDPNPFLESIPNVVFGIDIVFVSRGQAIVITLLSNADQIDTNREQFFTFVDQLEF